MSTKTISGTPSWLGRQNERTALALLLEHGVLTRNRLGALSGLSKPTAGQIVSRLESIGLIEVVGEVSAGRGPNAASYGVRADRVLGVAIEIDETTIRSTVVDATGAEHPVVETPIDADPVQDLGAGAAVDDHSAASDIRRAIGSACAAAHANMDAVRVVSIGVQGAIDPRSDELSFIDTLPEWPRHGIRAHLEAALGRQVLIDNDVNLAAIAERSEGAGAGSSSFALLWMGEGLGLATDLDGKVQRGAGGGAGEIGYLPVPQSASAIDPRATDLQQLVGGEKVIEIAKANGMTGSPRDIVRDLADHPAREAVLTAIAPRVAVGVVPVLAILDPELIVLGGPIGSAGGELLAELVGAELARTTPWRPGVTRSSVLEFPVLRGAREVLVHQVRQRLFSELG